MFDLILDSVEDFHTVEVRRLHRIFCGLCDAALDLFAGTRVVPLGIAPLPVGIFFAVASGCDFSDRTGTVGAFFVFILD